MNYMEAVEYVIDNMKDITILHRQQMEKLETDKKITLQEKKAAIEKLDTYVNLKEETEHDLYSRFILILNEKKKRIEHLNEIIEAYKEGKVRSDYDSDDSSEDTIEKDKRSSVKRLEMISDSDSDTEPENVQQVTHTVQIETPPSNKRKSGNEDDEIIPKRKTRNEEEKDNSDNDNISIVSTSSYDSDVGPPFKNAKKIMVEQVETPVLEEEKIVTSSESPEFNTQDLMDRL